jgi:hypothetical protein
MEDATTRAIDAAAAADTWQSAFRNVFIRKSLHEILHASPDADRREVVCGLRIEGIGDIAELWELKDADLARLCAQIEAVNAIEPPSARLDALAGRGVRIWLSRRRKEHS